MCQNDRMNIKNALIKLPIFREVAPHHLEGMARAARKFSVAKGQIIFRQGDSATAMYFLLEGHVKRTTSPADSDEKILDLIFPVQSFGEAELFSSRPYTSFAIAIEPSKLLCIDGASLFRTMKSDSKLSMSLLGALSNRQIDLESDIIASRSQTGCQRILDYLILLAGPRPATQKESPLVLPTSKQLIASRLGVTSETLSRSLRELSEAGLIVVDGKHILLQNEPIARLKTADLLKSTAMQLGSSHHPSMSFIGHHDALKTTPTPTPTSTTATLHRSLHGVINKAGRQRMLSQRMAKSWLMIGRNILPQRAKAILKQSVSLFDKQLEELASMPVSKEIRAALADVNKVWPPYKTLLESEPEIGSARKLFRMNEKVLRASHRLTQAFEQATDSTRNQLINLAGRERMLSQRMAKFYMFMKWGISDEKCQEELSKAIQEFETGLSLLSAGVHDNPQIRNQLDLVFHQWKLMRAALSMEHNKDISSLNATICTFSERLLKEMDAAVALYEKKIAA